MMRLQSSCALLLFLAASCSLSAQQNANAQRQTENVPDFDVDGIFARLADYDYDKAIALAQSLTREAPRAVATIAIAWTILAEKKR
jgi:hypothetical protein